MQRCTFFRFRLTWRVNAIEDEPEEKSSCPRRAIADLSANYCLTKNLKPDIHKVFYKFCCSNISGHGYGHGG